METIYKGYSITIEHDDLAECPRENDNAAVMFFTHKRYSLGDDWPMADTFHSWEELRQYIKRTYNPVEIQPVRMYDHSGITIGIADDIAGWKYPFTDRWDAGMIGFVFVPRDVALRECGVKRVTKRVRQWVHQVIKGEIAEYDSYLRGEVYGYTVTDSKGEVVDSCGGFIGDHDAVLTEAKGAVDSDIEYESHGLAHGAPTQLSLFGG